MQAYRTPFDAAEELCVYSLLNVQKQVGSIMEVNITQFVSQDECPRGIINNNYNRPNGSENIWPAVND